MNICYNKTSHGYRSRSRTSAWHYSLTIKKWLIITKHGTAIGLDRVQVLVYNDIAREGKSRGDKTLVNLTHIRPALNPTHLYKINPTCFETGSRVSLIENTCLMIFSSLVLWLGFGVDPKNPNLSPNSLSPNNKLHLIFSQNHFHIWFFVASTLSPSFDPLSIIAPLFPKSLSQFHLWFFVASTPSFVAST